MTLYYVSEERMFSDTYSSAYCLNTGLTLWHAWTHSPVQNRALMLAENTSLPFACPLPDQGSTYQVGRKHLPVKVCLW